MKVARFRSHFRQSRKPITWIPILREIARGETSVITADAVAVSAGGNTLKHATEHALAVVRCG